MIRMPLAGHYGSVFVISLSVGIEQISNSISNYLSVIIYPSLSISHSLSHYLSVFSILFHLHHSSSSLHLITSSHHIISCRPPPTDSSHMLNHKTTFIPYASLLASYLQHFHHPVCIPSPRSLWNSWNLARTGTFSERSSVQLEIGDNRTPVARSNTSFLNLGRRSIFGHGRKL